MSLVSVLIIAGLLFANAFFVAAEFALVKVRTSQIEQLAEEGSWLAKITSKILGRLDAYISASQLGITLASLGLGWTIHDSVQPFIELVMERMGVPTNGLTIGGQVVLLVPALSFLLVTFLHIALGELVPKSLAIRAAKVVALWTSLPLLIFYYVFFPIIWLLNKTSDLVLWSIGLGAAGSSEMTHTEEELRHIVAESVAGGHLSRNERVMIENVLNLEEKTARRVMVPRPDIVYLSLARPLDDNMRIARQTGHTRFPLCEDDMTTVVGMIHVKDLFRAGHLNGGRPDLRKMARPVPFLPETLHLDSLLVQFQRNRTHLAMLLDEYGSLVGMVSLENVLEELVGPIQDEFDRETPQVMLMETGAFDVDASCPLDVMAEACGIDLPETDAETAGGLVLELLGRLAREGDAVEVDRHRIVVTQADPTRIRRLRVEKDASAE